MDTKGKLSNTQIELLNLFSTNLSEAELVELRDLLAKFYAKKAVQAANEVWTAKNLTQQDIENWLNESK